jgi:hypothetical protein
MDIKDIKVGEYIFISKPGSTYDGEEGKVLSLYSDSGIDSMTVNIRLILDDGSIVGGFKESEVCP